MGGAVSSVGKIFDPITTVASSIPVVGPIAGPVAGYITGGPMGAAKVIAGTAITGGYSDSPFGGGGGGGDGGGGAPAPSGPTYSSSIPGSTGTFYSPTYDYGGKSYSVDSTPYDTSKYFIQGNKGTYNVLPQLSNLYGDPNLASRAGAPSANVYGDILGQIRMNQDTLAEQNFQKNFGLQSFAPSTVATSLPEDFSAPDYLKSDIQNALGEYYPSGSTPSGVVPVNYADFGFKSGDTLQKISDYAKKENNPFFMPFAPEDVRPEVDTRPKPIMPVSSSPTPTPMPFSYAPVTDARGPAPRDLAPASVASSGSFRPAETGSTTARTAAPVAPGMFKPVNIRTGGLASLRRS
jgi:hypothetical protein